MPGKSKKGGGLESSPVYKKSPLYNYRSPRDYKVFNMGNEASPPFKMKYQGGNSAFPFTGDTTKVKKPVKPVAKKPTKKEKEFDQFLKEFPNFMPPSPKPIGKMYIKKTKKKKKK